MFGNIAILIASFLKNLFNPLPDISKEANKFFALPLHGLMFFEIQELVRLMIDELRKSREFGLYVESRHFEKEEIFFLTVINNLGGMRGICKNISLENAVTTVSQLMFSAFKEELAYYFQKSKNEGASVLNRYDCHLESVRDRLLHEIYSTSNVP